MSGFSGAPVALVAGSSNCVDTRVGLVCRTDIADVAPRDGIGHCLRVRGHFVFRAHRNYIGSRACYINVTAKLIERHGWANIRQCVKKHYITGRNYLLGCRIGIRPALGGHQCARLSR